VRHPEGADNRLSRPAQYQCLSRTPRPAAYLGYIDGGMVILDISDKARPKMVSRWDYHPPLSRLHPYRRSVLSTATLFDRQRRMACEPRGPTGPSSCGSSMGRTRDQSGADCDLPAAAARPLTRRRRRPRYGAHKPLRKTCQSRTRGNPTALSWLPTLMAGPACLRTRPIPISRLKWPTSWPAPPEAGPPAGPSRYKRRPLSTSGRSSTQSTVMVGGLYITLENGLLKTGPGSLFGGKDATALRPATTAGARGTAAFPVIAGHRLFWVRGKTTLIRAPAR